MAVGLLLDARSGGLVQMLSQCRTAAPGTFGGVLASLAQMPLTCFGMFVGCQCGAWVRGGSPTGRATRRTAWLASQALPRTLWMLAGMALGHYAAIAWAAELPAAAFTLAVMVLMSAGMALGAIANCALARATRALPAGGCGAPLRELRKPAPADRRSRPASGVL